MRHAHLAKWTTRHCLKGHRFKGKQKDQMHDRHARTKAGINIARESARQIDDTRWMGQTGANAAWNESEQRIDGNGSVRQSRKTAMHIFSFLHVLSPWEYESGVFDGEFSLQWSRECRLFIIMFKALLRANVSGINFGGIRFRRDFNPESITSGHSPIQDQFSHANSILRAAFIIDMN